MRTSDTRIIAPSHELQDCSCYGHSQSRTSDYLGDTRLIAPSHKLKVYSNKNNYNCKLCVRLGDKRLIIFFHMLKNCVDLPGKTIYCPSRDEKDHSSDSDNSHCTCHALLGRTQTLDKSVMMHWRPHKFCHALLGRTQALDKILV